MENPCIFCSHGHCLSGNYDCPRLEARKKYLETQKPTVDAWGGMLPFNQETTKDNERKDKFMKFVKKVQEAIKADVKEIKNLRDSLYERKMESTT